MKVHHTDNIEQNKELNCLYEISNIFENADAPRQEILESVVILLPPAFHFSGIASAQILFDDISYTAGDFTEPKYAISEPIRITGTMRGAVQIAYPGNRSPTDQKPTAFLKEERRLLKIVAQQIALILTKKEVDDKHVELERQLHHADRLATVGQLAAGIAHELNDPLNNILGYAQLSSKQQDLPEQVYLDLDNIVRFSLHAREIVKKVMLFSRQMPPRQERVDVNKVIAESLYFTEPLCTKAGIEMVYDLPSDIPEIMADSSQLRQVIVNLIVNATQAIPKGKGRITVKTFGDSKHLVNLVIEDTGMGMSPETLQQCFMPFFTTKDIDEGTGLGLSVVHGIVQSHGGTITAASQEGKGSRFVISFPAKIGKEE